VKTYSEAEAGQERMNPVDRERGTAPGETHHGPLETARHGWERATRYLVTQALIRLCRAANRMRGIRGGGDSVAEAPVIYHLQTGDGMSGLFGMRREPHLEGQEARTGCLSRDREAGRTPMDTLKTNRLVDTKHQRQRS
jgi:hypothetical protein